MNFRKSAAILSLFACLVAFAGCRVKYSFTGASIPVAAKTFSVSYFPNNAPLVAPILSPTLTEAMQDKFIRQTRLQRIREGGDLHFEGEITGYTSTPSAITGNEQAASNRLTITVRVRFTDTVEPKNNYDRSFSAYLDYSIQRSLQDAEQELIPEIVTMLVDDIFNAAVSNW